MKAAVFRGIRQPLTIEDVEVNDAFRATKSGEVARIVLTFD